MTQATATRTARNAAKATDKVIEQARVSSSGSLAFKVGQSMGETMKRITSLDTNAVHKAYAKAKGEAQKTIRNDYVIGYMKAYLGVTQDVAATIWNQKRTERSVVHQRAADAAQKSFRFHVIRPEGKGAGAAAPVRVTTEFKVAATKFIESQYEEMNRASVLEAIKLLQAMAKRLK